MGASTEFGRECWRSSPLPEPRGVGDDRGKYQKMSALRLVFAIIGGLIMLFAGGCTLLFLVGYIHDSMTRSGGEQYVNIPAILTIGGPPFLIGLGIWFLAARAGRRLL